MNSGGCGATTMVHVEIMAGGPRHNVVDLSFWKNPKNNLARKFQITFPHFVFSWPSKGVLETVRNYE
jgi:hypothetical protein